MRKRIRYKKGVPLPKQPVRMATLSELRLRSAYYLTSGSYTGEDLTPGHLNELYLMLDGPYTMPYCGIMRRWWRDKPHQILRRLLLRLTRAEHELTQAREGRPDDSDYKALKRAYDGALTAFNAGLHDLSPPYRGAEGLDFEDCLERLKTYVRERNRARAAGTWDKPRRPFCDLHPERSSIAFLLDLLDQHGELSCVTSGRDGLRIEAQRVRTESDHYYRVVVFAESDPGPDAGLDAERSVRWIGDPERACVQTTWADRYVRVTCT